MSLHFGPYELRTSLYELMQSESLHLPNSKPKACEKHAKSHKFKAEKTTTFTHPLSSVVVALHQ